MMLKRFLGCILCALVLVIYSPASASPGNLILQVPDWNQPLAYGIGGYPLWCSPTAGGNIMGYWEDVKGCVGLTDRAVFPATIAGGYPATPNTWQQGLWIDGMIEMGWHMDTGTWQSSQGGANPKPFPPNSGSTQLANIGPGIVAYAGSGYVDAAGITKVPYNASVGIDVVRNAQMWTNYMAEIDAGRPAEVSFTLWVDTTVILPVMSVDGFAQIIEQYGWLTGGDPHSVVGVGYIDMNPGFQNNGADEWFICQDGWGTTGQYIAVPLDTHWLQNDYVYNVPEPMTIVLLAAGGMALLKKKK